MKGPSDSLLVKVVRDAASLTPLGEDRVQQDRTFAESCKRDVNGTTFATGGTAVAPCHPEMLTLLCWLLDTWVCTVLTWHMC